MPTQSNQSSYSIDPTAPCALCNSPSPSNRMDIIINKPQTWRTGYDKFTFADLPVCDACAQRRGKVMKIQTILFLSSVLMCGLATLAGFMIKTAHIGAILVFLFVLGFLILIGAVVSWRSDQRKMFHKIEAWAATYVRPTYG